MIECNLGLNLGLSLVSNTYESKRESEAENDQLHSPVKLDLIRSRSIAQLSGKQSISFSLLTSPKQLLSGASFEDGSANFDNGSSTSSHSFSQSMVHGDANVCAPACNIGLSTRSLQKNRINKCNSAKISCREKNIPSTTNSNGTSKDVEKRSPRKKLRLSKRQSDILEESFKQHSTINLNQKNALAKEVNLKARQIEVWFQNRRARTKSKQTEVNCEILKCCRDRLRQENKILRQEIQNLKALAAAPPCEIPHNFQRPLPEKPISICTFCKRFLTVDC
ncbi:hypothetical protein O6H91_06G061200 [Diphasiastrum complanatum]|uniref:Uncharacterized protein n=1 Tax=Diphasiastrum complanatum TaxID=34168 RepID=A0ACC2DEH3_DIPCM|nr:hypothetical protein O6H91_06G061200 [Diphasiastrum complanatum]